jgi:hypothetical protein
MSSAQHDPIADDAIVLRWLEEDHLPKLPGRRKPNSSLFQPSSDGTGTSVCVARDQREIDESLSLKPENFWVRLTVTDVTVHDLRLEWQPDDEIPRHAGILGWPESKKSRIRLQRLLADVCEWQGRLPPFPEDETLG